MEDTFWWTIELPREEWQEDLDVFEFDVLINVNYNWCKAEPDVGIMSDYVEVDQIEATHCDDYGDEEVRPHVAEFAAEIKRALVAEWHVIEGYIAEDGPGRQPYSTEKVKI